MKQYTFRGAIPSQLVIGVSGNSKQRRKVVRLWKRMGLKPVRFYMSQEEYERERLRK